MVKRLRPSLLVLFALWLGVQPMGQALAQAAAESAARHRELEAAARRMGVDALFLTDPDAYLARQEKEALVRRDAALKELERLYRPAPDVLARVKAEAEAIKDAHSASAFDGLASTLDSLDQAIAQDLITLNETGQPDSARLKIYQAILDAAQADVARAVRVELARAPRDAAKRVSQFHVNAQRQLDALASDLSSAPNTSAPADQWRVYLQHVRAALSVNPSANPPQYPIPNTQLPLGPLTAQPRPPRSSQWVYLRDEKRLPTDILRNVNPHQPDTVLTAMWEIRTVLTAASPPTPADLAETLDVHFTADIQSLISNLKSPIALFNYVQDNIDTDLYYGSKKGSTGTLYEMSGNDTDQASLLIALLRAANIPARYATGRVWLSAKQAQDLTNTTDTHAAADALTSAGIPTVYVNRPGLDPLVEIEHTWVRAWLPYETYRGVLEKSSDSDWIDLDPFIKQYTFNTPIDLRSAAAFNPDAYLSALTTTLPVDVWENTLRGYIKSNGLECNTPASAMRGRTIQPAHLDLLPAELPAIQLNLLGTFSSLPASARYAVNLKVIDAQGNVEINYDAALPAIYGQRIDLTFPAATPSDQAIMDGYGGLFDTPAYLVNLSPTLSLSETAVARGNPLRPGIERLLVATFTTPGLSSATTQVTHRAHAGGVYAFAMDYQSAPQRLLDDATERLAALASSGLNAQAQKLYVALLAYFREFNRGRDDVSGILQSGFIRDLGAGFAAQQVRVTTLYGAPTRLAPGPYFLDVPKLSFAFYDIEGGQDRSAQVATLVGYNSSALEHLVWQREFGEESVSAVKALQIAASQGQTLHTITDPSQVNGLGVSQDVKGALLDALNRGWQAKVSQNAVTLNRWSGVGYILYDPVLGSAGYMISGGLNGGSTTGDKPPEKDTCGKGMSFSCLMELLFDPRQVVKSTITAIVGDPVNLTNGNLLETASDLFVPARGLPIAFARTFNSLDSQNGRMGWGWTDTFDQRIVTNADGSRSFLDQDGHEYRFTLDGAGGFTHPAGYHYTLIQTTSGYKMTTLAGAGYEFAQDGHCTAMILPDGNHTALVYNGAQLVSVVDSAGRTALTFAYDANNRITVVADADNRSVRYSYNAQGDLASFTDVNGKTTTYTYDGQHHLLTKSDAMGHTDTFVYDADGRVFRHVNPVGSVESFSYDSFNHRAARTDPVGNTTLYSYDAHGRVVGFTDPMGNQTSYVYDGDNNLLQQTNARGHTINATYDAEGQILNSTDVLGNVASYTYDGRGLVISSTRTVSGTAINNRWVYDNAGNVINQVDGAGRAITNTYDANGQLLRITDNTGATTDYSYSANGVVQNTVRSVRDADGNTNYITTSVGLAPGGLVNLIRDGAGNVFTATIDAIGHVLSVGSPDGTVQASFQYDDAGRPIKLTDRTGYTTTYLYDAAGRFTGQADSFGNLIHVSYDAAGRVTQRQDQAGRTTRYQYDELSRLVRTVHPDGSITGYGYCANSIQICASVDSNGDTTTRAEDAAGRVLTETDELGNTIGRVYDELGRIIQVTNAEGQSTSFAYDHAGNLLRVVDALNHLTAYTYQGSRHLSGVLDANGHSHSLAYDDLGRLVRVADALNNTARYYYDGAGRRTTVIDATGRIIHYTYDAFGAVTSISGPDGATTFARNANRQLVAAANPDSTFAYAYDRVGNVISTTQVISGTGKTIQFAYTPDAQTAAITNAEGGVTLYTSDIMGRLIAISEPDGSRIIFAYDAGGRRARMALPNGITTFYTYDAADRLLGQISRHSDGQVVAAFGYTYDRTGHRTSMTDLSGQATTYSYDALYRLTGVTYGNGLAQAFTYDAVGNRLSQTVNGVGTTYTYDAADRLIYEVRGGVPITYTYDNNGSLITLNVLTATTVFTYNHFNRLKAVGLPDGSRWDMGYSPAGLRVYEMYTPPSGPVQRTDFLLEGAGVLADYTRTGNGDAVVTHYLRGAATDELLGLETGGVRTYFISGGLGSVSVATDDIGHVIGRRVYDAFGAVIEQTGSLDTRYGFTGREAMGNTNLLYYRARVYDPSIGRFTSADPTLGHLTLPETLNRYVYAKNDPININDPSGQDFFVDIFWDSFLKDGKSILSLAGIIAKALFCIPFMYLCAAINLFDTFVTSLAAVVDIYGKYNDGSIPIAVQNCACGLVMGATLVVAGLQLAELYFNVGRAVLVTTFQSLATEAAEMSLGYKASQLVVNLLSELLMTAIGNIQSKLIDDSHLTPEAGARLGVILGTANVMLAFLTGKLIGDFSQGPPSITQIPTPDPSSEDDRYRRKLAFVVGLFKIFISPEVTLGLCTVWKNIPPPTHPPRSGPF